MTTQLLATELANLIQESKRKNNDLRQAAEKSLEELKSLGNISEQAAPEQLSAKTNFVNPFIIACGTKNAKFTSIAIVCLQRLIVAKALPKTRLSQVLEALMQASSAALDVQLKILQALPSLLQNYATELKGDLLFTALNICFTLQSSKNAIVHNTSAATLQQLIVSVFDKVVAEDKNGTDSSAVGEVSTAQGKVTLRSAALDAYRVFNDLCLLTENQRPEFLRFSGVAQTFGLELIESVITNHASVFTTHPEQIEVLRVRLMPLIISVLKSKPSFATTVRVVRILYTLLRRHITILPSECGEAMDIMTKLIDQDTPLWKRALCMEVFRGIFAEHNLVRRIFALYDAKEGQKDILKTLTASFVRVSTEKPTVIGLGHQSTMPVFNASNNASGSNDQAMLETSGVTGIITTSSGSSSEGLGTGISTQWSSIRVPCIDQLDKAEPPPIPESYIYSLILACISSLSDGLAKFVLPLTVPNENRSRRRATRNDGGRDSPAPSQGDGDSQSTMPLLERSGSFKKNPVPVNPLSLTDHPMHSEVKICSSIVDECWPAVLATCSTFLYSALDSEYYHGLVRAFQRFAHVAGLLQLSTPRDAFLTTLGKAAVPPNVLTACLNSSNVRPTSSSTPGDTTTSLLDNARGLLSPEGRTPTSATLDKQRQISFDAFSTSLNTRNLLCLRALLNLGIALGPTLDSAWRIVLETLQQADFVLYSTGRAPGRTPSLNRTQDQSVDSEAGALMANFNQEVKSVETAAGRLMESTVDFPNEGFIEVVNAICGLLRQQPREKKQKIEGLQPAPSPQLLRGPSGQHRRVLSFSNQVSSSSTKEDEFALAKIGEAATINIDRLLAYSPETSGWDALVGQLIDTIDSATMAATVRVKAAEILSNLMLEAAIASVPIPSESRGEVQLRVLGALRDTLASLRDDSNDTSLTVQSTEDDIHRIILNGLKSVVENCGESLVSGWDIAFDIIGSIFIGGGLDVREARRASTTTASALETRSPKLIRPSFNSLQLICSDFLTALPNTCFLILVDTLYKFCSQDDDLNIALTTVTFYWALSDFLSGKNESLEITAEFMHGAGESDLRSLAADRDSKGSDAALWMLLLLKLTAVTSDDRLELRNSAIQTLLRIFDAYGDRLNSEAWSICIKCVIFKLLTSLEHDLELTRDEGVDKTDRVEWHETAVVVLNGISSLLANYIEVLTDHPSFNHLWRELLGHFATLLDFKVLDINTATFKALSHVLSQSGDAGQKSFSQPTINFAWELWSRGIPVSRSIDGQDGDNQNCLVAYVAALNEVYRLIQADITEEQVQRILELLRATVEEAVVTGYVGDIENMTTVQSKVMDSVRMIRTDVPKVPSAIIKQVAELITLAFNQENPPSPNSKRTFVAMSKASMKVMEELILSHATDQDLYSSGALSSALAALSRPIGLKYHFRITTKSVQPWKAATSAALVVLEATLPRLEKLNVPAPTVQAIWAFVVEIADGILSADCDVAATGTKLPDDEDFDIASFQKLRTLVIPAIGAEAVPEKTRKAYVDSLFRASMIHELPPSDAAIISGGSDGGVSALYTPRAGRTVAVLPRTRARISYVALDELFALTSSDAETVFGESTDKSKRESSSLRARTAATTASYLILRCALSLRSYVADQPLRGKMPQPLSQKKELLQILRKLIDLRSEKNAIPDLGGVESESRKHLLRLYPLLVQALSVGSDDKVMQMLREALEVVGGELGL